MSLPLLGGGSGRGAPPTWTTTFSNALAGLNSTGWNGFNLRQLLLADQLSTSGSLVRVTLKASTAASCTIDHIYIGHQAGSGDPYDFDGNQVQLFVGGSASFVIALNTSVVTDAAGFSFDETKPIIIAAHFNAVSAVAGADALGSGSITKYEKSAADETSVSNVTGYSATTFALRLVSTIEVAL